MIFGLLVAEFGVRLLVNAKAKAATTMELDHMTPEKKEEVMEPVDTKEKVADAVETDGRQRRERRSVERLTLETTKSSPQDKMQEGKGTMLRDIPNISYRLSKITGRSEVVEALHMLMYRRKGTAQSRKKEVLDFRGLSFADEASEDKEIESRMTSMGKMTVAIIHEMMDLLDIKRGSGDKMSKMELLMSFLKQPKRLSDVDLAAKDADKKLKAKRQRERKAKAAAKKKRKVSGKASNVSKDVCEDFEIASEDSEEEEIEPAHSVSVENLKHEIYTMLGNMSDEDFSTVTTKIIMMKLNDIYNCDMRPRKPEVKMIAQEYAMERMSTN